MNPAARIAFVAALAVLSACGAAHLGPHNGVATREALAAQRASEPGQPPTFGADVAHGALAAERHSDRGAPGATASGPSSGGGVAGAPPAASGSSSGAWPGASGGIKLEAR